MSDHGFGFAGTVGVGGIEEVDTRLVGGSMEFGGNLQVTLVEGEPGSESNLRDDESTVSEASIVQRYSLRRCSTASGVAGAIEFGSLYQALVCGSVRG